MYYPPFTSFINTNIKSQFNSEHDHEHGSVVSDDLSIHFMELGNEKTGDSIYIKANDVDILIDAGSRKSSATTIATYMDQYVTDDQLEYVIATHSDQDHIAGFVGSSSDKGIFDRYKINTLIDFTSVVNETQLYKDYMQKRTDLAATGTKTYTALECYKEQNGAKKEYDLSETIKLEVLYNYYYDHSTSDNNNYSVCVMFTQTTTTSVKRFLFTGDLEKSGEEKLVSYNTLKEVELFKAGHHGSPTSSNDTLLSVIKPKIVCVCCCAGSDEYSKDLNNQFPSQAFISRICKYTDKVYVTSIVSNLDVKPLNGNILVKSTDTTISVICSNNDTILKDTEWFKKYRKWE